MILIFSSSESHADYFLAWGPCPILDSYFQFSGKDRTNRQGFSDNAERLAIIRLGERPEGR